ncbi:MAG: hypothetical protein KIH01_08815, partial [Candidatus Freyarchaeota archaeon]|nr:hypothetical protein [Candidatus Jordarchaeia archaeon]
MNKDRKPLRRGLSEAVVIMIVIMIAVTLGFGLKTWYDTQMRKLPTTDMATAEWSATYGTDRWIVAVNVHNNLDRSIVVQSIRLTFANGTVYTLPGAAGITVTPTPGSVTVSLKGSLNFVVVIPMSSPTPA